MAGHVYKRCSCPVVRDETGRRLTCPKSHGTWTYVADAPVDGTARRKQVSKGGFTTKRDAEAALREFLTQVDRGVVVLPSRQTLAEYLKHWLRQIEPSLAPTAASNYRALIRLYVRPQLGAHRLSALRPHHLVDGYRRLLQAGGRKGRPLSATTVRTVHRILNKASLTPSAMGSLSATRRPICRCREPSSPSCRSGGGQRSRASFRSLRPTGLTRHGCSRCCAGCAATSLPASADATSILRPAPSESRRKERRRRSGRL